MFLQVRKSADLCKSSANKDKYTQREVEHGLPIWRVNFHVLTWLDNGSQLFG